MVKNNNKQATGTLKRFEISVKTKFEDYKVIQSEASYLDKILSLEMYTKNTKKMDSIKEYL